MSWKSGMDVAEPIVVAMREHVPAEVRRPVYDVLIRVFEDNDCDTLYHLVDTDEVFADAFKAAHPGTYQ
jgi:hypothetical protein